METRERRGAFNVKEFAKLTTLLREEGAPLPVIVLIELVGGQKPFDEVLFHETIKALSRKPTGTGQVKPHPNAIECPGTKHKVGRTGLDASIPKKKK